MIHFTTNDFEAISVLVPPQHRADFIVSNIAESSLREIRLFRLEKAKEVERKALPIFREMYPYLFDASMNTLPYTKEFRELKRLQNTVSSIHRTKEWLRSLEIPALTEMIVSYDFQTAFEMPWIIFVGVYDTLCYSSLDDIYIFSVSERWYLLYYHEDIFLFGERNSKAENETD